MKNFKRKFKLSILMMIFFNLFIVSHARAQLFNDYTLTNIDSTKLLVTYSMVSLRDTLKPEKLRQDDMLLFLGTHTSKFISLNHFLFDSIMESINTVQELQEMLNVASQMPVVEDGYLIYKNYENGEMTHIEHIPSDTYKFEESFDIFKWQIHDDTATIKGYNVQKASCDFGGRTWVAWFTPEIPYSDGPYKFTGLPGLILNIHDTQNHYNFEFGSIEKPSNSMKMITYKEKNYIETTKYGFFRAQDGFRHDIVNRAKAAGMSSETQQIAARNLLKRNNPIELKRK